MKKDIYESILKGARQALEYVKGNREGAVVHPACKTEAVAKPSPKDFS